MQNVGKNLEINNFQRGVATTTRIRGRKLNTHEVQCRTIMRGRWSWRRRGSFTVKPIPYINVVLSFISFYFQIKISHSTYGECDAMVVWWRWRAVRGYRHSQMLVRIPLFKFVKVHTHLYIHNEWINFLMTLLSSRGGIRTRMRMRNEVEDELNIYIEKGWQPFFSSRAIDLQLPPVGQ